MTTSAVKSSQEAVAFSSNNPEQQAAIIAFIVARMNWEIAKQAAAKEIK